MSESALQSELKLTLAEVDAAERAALYRIMALRRDCRHFTPGPPLPEAQLERLLEAANQGPSVGLMQPWRFLRLSTPAWRARGSFQSPIRRSP